jgi:hypothetical protein
VHRSLAPESPDLVRLTAASDIFILPTRADMSPLTAMEAAACWARNNGTYIAGRAYVDGADETAAEMEAKWGADRLRLLVGPELREKFDLQRYLFNQTIWHGDLEDVRREAGRMVKAWLALDRAADAAGALKMSPLVEVPLEDGSVAALVPDVTHAKYVITEGRQVAVYTDRGGRAVAFEAFSGHQDQVGVSGRRDHRVEAVG